jgi:aspartate aminotransferase-like enzyme
MAEINFPKLFIPGPVHVTDDILQAMASYPLGHRTPEFNQLYAGLQPKLKQILHTEQNVFIFTNSATAVMEACIRNLVKGRALNMVCGAFSDRWHSITKDCAKPCDAVSVEWGQPTTPEAVDAALSAGDYDTITIVHNESSTGLMNPVAAIATMIREKHPDVMICIDAVSSMAGAPIKFDEWGADVVLASVQKAWGIPAGIAIAAVSDRALERAKTVEGRGQYLDFLAFAKNDAKNFTPNTPSTSHFVALDVQCDKILAEGIENRWARHERMATKVRDWAKQRWTLFPAEGYESLTLTCIDNRDESVDVPGLIKAIYEKHNARIANGYGGMKNKTWRISHMADLPEADLDTLLGWLDAELA